MNKENGFFLVLFFLYACNEQVQNNTHLSSVDTVTVISNSERTKLTVTSLDSASQNFLDFWEIFRQAAVTFDTVRIKTLCAFPVKYRGTFDDDPVVLISEGQFGKYFILFLKQWSGQDLEGSTELEFIKKTERASLRNDEKQIRIGNMVFFRKDKSWKLGFLYFKEETIELLSQSKDLK